MERVVRKQALPRLVNAEPIAQLTCNIILCVTGRAQGQLVVKNSFVIISMGSARRYKSGGCYHEETMRISAQKPMYLRVLVLPCLTRHTCKTAIESGLSQMLYENASLLCNILAYLLHRAATVIVFEWEFSFSWQQSPEFILSHADIFDYKLLWLALAANQAHPVMQYYVACQLSNGSGQAIGASPTSNLRQMWSWLLSDDPFHLVIPCSAFYSFPRQLWLIKHAPMSGYLNTAISISFYPCLCTYWY